MAANARLGSGAHFSIFQYDTKIKLPQRCDFNYMIEFKDRHLYDQPLPAHIKTNQSLDMHWMNRMHFQKTENM